MNKKREVYLDYAATTPIDSQVLKKVKYHLKKTYGNTSSLHQVGNRAKKVVETSRKVIAKYLNASKEEIFFTSSATESNNTILKGVSEVYRNKGKHIIISSIEHDCIMKSAYYLSKRGFRITKIPVDKFGFINLNTLKRIISKDTILVSVMHANNEIGTIEPIEEIGKICRKNKVFFHTDASQTFGKIPIDTKAMNIDLLTASSHKMYGPKGVALLYKKKGIRIEPLLHGGGHEKGLRSSTVNAPLIAGFAKAVEITHKEIHQETKREKKLRDKFIKKVLNSIPDSYLNGPAEKRLANNINIRFSFVEGEAVVMRLDKQGICTSTGSACSSQSLKPSHVLTEIGLRPEEIHGAIRFSIGKWTKKKDLENTAEILTKVIIDLRKLSPFTNHE